MMCPPYMISPKRYRRSSHGTYEDRLSGGFCVAPEGSPAAPGKLRVAAELWGHGAMVSREVTDSGPAEAR